MDQIAKAFVDYAFGLTFADLSPASVHSAKRSVINSIGCALGAFAAEPLKAIRELAAQVTAVKPATIIGTQSRSSPEMAALANGAMIRYLDFSDDYFGGEGDIGPHPSDNLCGVLAAIEAAGGDGRALILGLTIAYEACGQITQQIDLKGIKPTWDYTVLHSIGTSLGAAKVFRLTREQMHHALALAVVANVTLLQTRVGELSNWKAIAGPNGSRNGLFAVMLARAGITGPEDPFEGKAGLMRHLNLSLAINKLGGRGQKFKIEETFYKRFPVRYGIQLPIEVAFEARKSISLEDVDAIRVYVIKRYVASRADDPEYWNPTTRETTDHSFPYLIGAALVDGAITERTFTAERYRDPAVLALVQKISLAEDPEFTTAFPRTFNCRFEITLKSGKIISFRQTNPKGHPANPMSDSDVEAKFLQQTETASIPQARARELLDRLWELDRQTSFDALFSLMQVPSR